MAGESKSGRHAQSIEPLAQTKATVRVSPITPYRINGSDPKTLFITVVLGIGKRETRDLRIRYCRMRLIVVSNRLPVQLNPVAGKLVSKPTVGGVATGISSYINGQKQANPGFEHIWVGWPGVTVPDDSLELTQALGSDYFPVHLTEEQMENFYDGFCNKTLWPLFHYFPSLTEFQDAFWQEYVQVNVLYCNRVAEILQSDDVVFINDYHLLLLPRLLRDLFPDIKICFFLHIPFPEFEIFRLLPSHWRNDILTGMTAANLVGFHTHAYTEHFLRCVQRILGREHTLGEIKMDGYVLKADTFPMGIDFQYFSTQSESAMPWMRMPDNAFRKILSVDRLDYTKGILNRLKGFELFLTKFPEMQGRVQLHVIAVPSRIGVDRYQNLKRQLDELVGKINGAFSAGNWVPIFYQYASLTMNEMLALYRNAGIALITPLRDGMNLIAKEYLAARNDNTGVLIISEMAGAARELAGAILVNPNSISEIADAIKQALEIPVAEQVARNEPMRRYLEKRDIKNWMNEIMDSLTAIDSKTQRYQDKYLSSKKKELVVTQFRSAKNRVVLLDYDGTLVDFRANPQEATADEALQEILDRMVQIPDTLVYVVSGRERGFLSQNIKNSAVGLIAEHGAFIRSPRERGWQTIDRKSTAWFEKILPVMERYENRVYGSFIEKKESALVFHYRNALGEPELVRERINELFDDLLHFTSNINVQVMRGSSLIEVRNQGATKGTAGLSIVSLPLHDFILAIGDDTTDEDMFQVLPASACTIRVGVGESAAKFYVRDVQECRQLLKSLVAIR